MSCWDQYILLRLVFAFQDVLKYMLPQNLKIQFWGYVEDDNLPLTGFNAAGLMKMCSLHSQK
jgi:hypothetical protein